MKSVVGHIKTGRLIPCNTFGVWRECVKCDLKKFNTAYRVCMVRMAKRIVERNARRTEDA